ncbi:MAG: helix-hairpin-helix domain-containing protein [Candidatus Marithrix sp.]|nr:helix-hairpin-helix domain-containing protein [Candidatus Marithrix sp.]
MQKLVILFFISLSIFILPIAHAETNIDKININTADAITLEDLWGIGPQKATAIVEFRDKNGVFESIDSLKNVKGIGQKIIDENQGKIEVALIPEEIVEDSEQKGDIYSEENIPAQDLGDESSSAETTKNSATEVEK